MCTSEIILQHAKNYPEVDVIMDSKSDQDEHEDFFF